MTDHIHDSEITDAIKRAEAAEREVAKMRELYRIDGKMITVLGIMLVISMCVAACCIAALGTSRDHALDARDACEVQSQLYLDGWRQCVKARYEKAPEVIWKNDSGANCYKFTDGSEACDGAVEMDTRSLLDPVRRIDR